MVTVRHIAGGLAGAAAGELASSFTGTVGPTDGLARLVADRLPLGVVESAVFRLHRRDKTALRLASAAAVAAGSAAAVCPGARPVRRRAALFAGVCGVVLHRPPRRVSSAILTSVTATVAAVAAAHVAGRRPTGSVAVSAAAVAAAVSVHSRRRRDEAMRVPSSVTGTSIVVTDGAEGWRHPTPLMTPLERFHVTDVNFSAPNIGLDTWRLRLDGTVSRPMTFDWTDLCALGTVDLDAVLVCIHNRVGWERAANARWTGVPLESLRELVGADPAATHLVTEAADGFTIALPMGELESAGLDAYVVVGMNGRRLTVAHGAPARVLVPGLYGQFAGVKWLTGIRFADHHVPGDWERRGWPPRPVMVLPHARIDRAGEIGGAAELAGVAWAPPHGVAAVEVSVDRGPWARVNLAAELSPLAWRRWRCRLPLAPGAHRVRARSISRNGLVQDGTPRSPFPSGVTGYHEVVVTIARS